MATILKSTETEGANFEPHPAGSFLAVLADVFVKSFPNKYKGQALTMGKNKGKPDERETIDKVCFAFLTEEPIEVDGELKPRYASFWAGAGLGTAEYQSNARKFLKGWWPTLTDAIIDAGLDLDKFIEKGAYLTIAQSIDKRDPNKVWSNVIGAMQPPKGSTIPQIPADFVRHDNKPAAAPVAQAAPAAQPTRVEQARAAMAKPLNTTAPDNSLPALDKFEDDGSTVDPW